MSGCTRERYVGLRPEIDKIVAELASRETRNQIGPMLRMLVEEALRARGEL